LETASLTFQQHLWQWLERRVFGQSGEQVEWPGDHKSTIPAIHSSRRCAITDTLARIGLLLDLVQALE
jgi:hypothetical protein